MKALVLVFGLISLTTAVRIECRFQDALLILDFGRIYTCLVVGITLTGNRELEEVTGNHVDFRTNADVKQLDFGWTWPSNCHNLTFIPQKITNFFPNYIGMMFWSSCNIRTLTGDDLKDNPNLEYFFVRHNSIQRIPGDFFQFNRKLTFAFFGNNIIEHVGTDLFTHLTSLTSLFFFQNTCIDEYAYNNRTGVVQIIETLRIRCFDPNDHTSTTLATSTEGADPTCPVGNTDQRICDLEDENKELRDTVSSLQQDMQQMEEKLIELISRPCFC
jgi:Leucine rich repeat